MAAASSKNAKNSILKKINKLSAKAARYAIPNEVDAILAQIGGTNVNAFTSNDITVYHNVFPAGELEKWSVIYAERFRNPVFRLFQSELEAVYEEYNMYSDDPFSVFAEDVEKAVFGDNPYGRPIIGWPEHIKNPSMSKMHEFFKAYYTPRNMTLILVGDFNADEAIKTLNMTWCGNKVGKETSLNNELQLFKKPVNGSKPVGVNKKKAVPSSIAAARKLPPVNAILGKKIVETAQTPVKVGAICYQTVPSSDDNSVFLELCADILSNSFSTGLVDKLMNDNKLYSFSCYNNAMSEAGVFEITYVPKMEGQTHEQAEELINQCIQQLKSGDFSDQLFEAVKMNYLKNEKKGLESIYSKFFTLLSFDVDHKTVKDYENKLEMVSKLTKSALVAVANEYLGDNMLVYRSDVGSKKVNTIEKPTWKPITSQNADKHSDFANSLEQYNSQPTRIQKINFDKDLSITSVNNAFDLYSTTNPCNDIFSLNLIFDYGTVHHKDLANAFPY
ncbi:MAG: insulinase family protein, partial [Bacteroidales bacterium]|nr:insulinase family protein [Bacteroidales bacterium]